MVFLNELKKALNRTTIGVLICVLILNAILIISGEKDRGYSFTAEDYRALYDSAEMQGNTD